MNATTLNEVEVYLGTTLVPVATSDLINADRTPTAYYWEIWNGGFGRNKNELRQAGLGVRKIEGRWIVGGAL
jgi:hypothetical protein